ncbi:MAG TPA: branched-chain amino acid ABC transporter permease [Pusillimonas sp.]
MDNLNLLLHIPVLNLQLIINGLLIGGIFALSAYGLALVWGVMNVINVAQGEFVMLGGYIVWALFQVGVNPVLGIPLAAVIMYLVGVVLYRLAIFRVVGHDFFISILATFGLSILIQQLLNQVFGADVRTVSYDLGTWFLFDSMVSIPRIKVVAFVSALVLGAVLISFMRYSRLGQAIRATSQNARAARILGIDTDRVYAATFGLNAAICAAAGGLVAMVWLIQPYQGLPYTIRSFMIVIVAGLGNLFGVIVAALGLGVAENYAGFIFGAEYQAAFVYVLLVLILVWRNLWLRRQRKYLS